MSEATFSKTFNVVHDDFTQVGEASTQTKTILKQIGYDSDVIRRLAIAMYEGEINMVIHAQGGKAILDIYDDRIEVLLEDVGPGIKDIGLAMKEGYSTASEEARSLGFGAGMGLSNMKKYTDDMKIETEIGKGTRVWIMVKAD